METEIIKKITPNRINELFDYSNMINIRYYQPSKQQIIDLNKFDVAVNYRIRIRHNEEENPRKLLNDAIKKQFK